MSGVITLKAEPRKVLGKKVKTLRRHGVLPAVVYGHKTKAQPLSVDLGSFNRAYAQAGTSSLIEIDIGGQKKINALAHEPQYDPIQGTPIHVDFHRVKMDEKIRTEIPLQFTGKAPAVEQLDGTLVTPRDNIEVECLPKDLVHSINIDLSKLATLENQIKVGDITPPPGVEFVTDAEEVIALVEPPRSEEELAELETSAAETEVEAVEQAAGEKEEEEAGEDDSKAPEEDKKDTELEEEKRS